MTHLKSYIRLLKLSLMRVAPLKCFSAIPVFESLHDLAGLFEDFYVHEILGQEIKYQSQK
jgi:hypothetical protein